MRTPETDIDRAQVDASMGDPLAWWRARLAPPCAQSVIYSDELIDAAAEIDATKSLGLFAEVRQLVRAAGGNLNDWNRAVNQRRRERTEQAALKDGLRRTLEGAILPTLHNACSLIDADLGARLTFNEMTRTPHLDGEPMRDVDLTRIRRSMEVNHDVAFHAAEIEAAITERASSRPFHPVRDYLRSTTWDRKPRLGRVAADYLGAADPLSNMLVMRSLIAAVARALDPGVKADNVLVLIGDQGFKKSTFFRVMGGRWFVDSRVDIATRQGIITLHSSWIYEIAEVEKLMTKKESGEIKAFASQCSDDYVPPYGKASVTAPRSFICVGTTNEPRFLVDLTGSRRWLPVPVTRRIDDAALAANRDQIWAEAVACYDAFLDQRAAGALDDENPHRWWLDEGEERARAKRAESHQAAAADSERIERWLSGEPRTCAACKGSCMVGSNDCYTCKGKGKVERPPMDKDKLGREYVTLSSVMEGAMGIRPEDFLKHQNRIAGILRSLGWKDGPKIRTGGRESPKVTPYYAPTYENEERAALADAAEE